MITGCDDLPTARLSITGLQEFAITFEDYCSECPTKLQRYCPHGKDKPLVVHVECKEVIAARDAQKYEQMRKMQKKATAGTSLDFDSIKVSESQIISHLWHEKIKKPAEGRQIRCMGKEIDPIEAAQRGQDWWQDFRVAIKQVIAECRKISNL
ncbi:MAG: hypothetical protein Kow0069_10970 [Promethearchaeota archaeon]